MVGYLQIQDFAEIRYRNQCLFVKNLDISRLFLGKTILPYILVDAKTKYFIKYALTQVLRHVNVTFLIKVFDNKSWMNDQMSDIFIAQNLDPRHLLLFRNSVWYHQGGFVNITYFCDCPDIQLVIYLEWEGD